MLLCLITSMGVCRISHAYPSALMASLRCCFDGFLFGSSLIPWYWPEIAFSLSTLDNMLSWVVRSIEFVITIPHVRHVLRFPLLLFWFFLCKDSASVILQGHRSRFDSKIFQRFWGAVAPDPNSLKPCGLKIFRSSLAFTWLLLACSVLLVKITKSATAQNIKV